MNRSADQALRSLLPTHNGAFPPQLADLAGSLLAQSRHRASTLKADEEIARAYACAHIACDRLKTVLNLPPIDPHPPIQPRLYKRLYTHLNTILQPAPATRGDHASRNDNEDNNSPLGVSPSRKRRTAVQTRQAEDDAAAAASSLSRKGLSRMPSSSRKTPGMSKTTEGTPKAATFPPPWLRPTVRFVCKHLEQPQLAPTLMAGLSAIHRESALADPRVSRNAGEVGEDGSAVWVETNLTALTAALYLYCVTSWRDKSGGGGGGGDNSNGVPLEEGQFQADEKALLATFDLVRSDQGVPTPADLKDEADKEAFWAGWRPLRRRTFRDALVVVSDRQWLQSDWYRDIAAVRAAGQDWKDDNEEGEGSDDDGETSSSLPTKMWRADSMLQARYDFLSEAKQQAYDAWRTKLLAQIQAAEQQQTQAPVQPQRMEIDSWGITGRHERRRRQKNTKKN